MAGIYSSSEKYKPGLVVNYENAMKYKLLPVLISFATTEGGGRQTAKSKLLQIFNYYFNNFTKQSKVGNIS